ncbi:MAG TPA: hypothetical protein VFT22_10885 [Kofleriaceae bacterium]|nr:hypothetical protein [Kofleriaceae bacterium]
MSFRTGILPAIDAIRAIAGPAGLDVEVTRLTIRTRVWSGGRNGAGTPVDTDLVLPQIYDVAHVTEQQIASSGGRYEMGDIHVGPITPAFTGGGFTPAQLKPNGADGTEIIYLLSGAAGINGEYACIALHTEEAFEYHLYLRRTRKTP